MLNGSERSLSPENFVLKRTGEDPGAESGLLHAVDADDQPAALFPECHPAQAAALRNQISKARANPSRVQAQRVAYHIEGQPACDAAGEDPGRRFLERGALVALLPQDKVDGVD